MLRLLFGSGIMLLQKKKKNFDIQLSEKMGKFLKNIYVFFLNLFCIVRYKNSTQQPYTPQQVNVSQIWGEQLKQVQLRVQDTVDWHMTW